MQKVAQKEYVVITKGLAIVLVVVGHVLQDVRKLPFSCDLGAPIDFLVDLLYAFHMPLFFVLSGLLAGSPGGGLHGRPRVLVLVRSKASRILLPYFSVSLVHISLRALVYERIAVSELPAKLLTLLYAPTGHLWFLYALFSIFLLTPMLEQLLGQRRWAVIIVLGFMAGLGERANLEVCEIGRILQFALYFYFGVLMGRSTVSEGDSWPWMRRYVALFAFAFFGLVYLRQGPRSGVSWVILRALGEHNLLWILWVLQALAGSMVFIRFGQVLSGYPLAAFARGARMLGRYSYDIYLFHFILLNFAHFCLLDARLSVSWVIPVILLLVMVISALPLLGGKFLTDKSTTLSLLFRGRWPVPPANVETPVSHGQARNPGLISAPRVSCRATEDTSAV